MVRQNANSCTPATHCNCNRYSKHGPGRCAALGAEQKHASDQHRKDTQRHAIVHVSCVCTHTISLSLSRSHSLCTGCTVVPVRARCSTSGTIFTVCPLAWRVRGLLLFSFFVLLHCKGKIQNDARVSANR